MGVSSLVGWCEQGGGDVGDAETEQLFRVLLFTPSHPHRGTIAPPTH